MRFEPPAPSGRARVLAGRGGAAAAALLISLWVVAVGCAGGDGPGGVPDSGPAATSVSITTLPTSTTGSSTTAPPFASTTAPVVTTTTGDPGPVVVPEGGREVASLSGAGDVVALTFDAAYDPAPLADILQALTQAGVPATFFLTGEFAEDFPERVAAIVEAGFPIGNHTYSHPDLTGLDAPSIHRQLERTSEALAAAGAPDPRPLFRFPYGARDARTLAEVGAAGYVSVYWTIDTLDWKPERTPEEVERAVLEQVRPGAIVLMHVGSRQTAQVLPSMIRGLRARGYEFVDVRAVLAALPGVGG